MAHVISSDGLSPMNKGPLLGKTPADPSWDVTMDLNDDGIVNMRDVGMAVGNFGKHV